VHFEHANGAESLIAVWLSGDDLSAERELLALIGATFAEEEVRVPDVARATMGARRWPGAKDRMRARCRPRGQDS
jgi:hypothetical protein